MPLSKTHQMQLNTARTVGGSPSIYVTNGELAFLLCVICRDLGLERPSSLGCSSCTNNEVGFYETPIKDAKCNYPGDDADGNDLIDNALSDLMLIDQDVFTYFWALTSIHSQRRKFRAILDYQPLPELETVIPRGLLDLGELPADALASWLVWRKFIYDIDNRAAQTAGYLFEPILAASIGGTPYSAKNSPIKRKGTGSGRQVDCIVNKDAYEFKMRVTIAASGQGRFGEELSFAEDCHLSDYRPVLLVLDPTPSAKLDELSREYRRFDGEAYIGNDAWSHLESRAGSIMARFVEKYVRNPISQIDGASSDIPSIALSYDQQANRITLTIGNNTYHLR